MHLSQIAAEFKAHFEASVANGEKYLAEHIPHLADLAEKAASNPLVDAALGVVHVSPEMLSAFADVLRRADADLAALAAIPAAEVPAEPVAELPADVVPADAQAS